MHLPVEEKAEQATWPKPLHQKVIVTAGVSIRSVDASGAHLVLQPHTGLQPCTCACELRA